MKQNLLTHIMRLTILFLLFFGAGTGSAVAGPGLEWGGTNPTKPTALASDLADPAVGPAVLDFLSGNTAGITAAARVNRLRAWEALLPDEFLRKNPDKLAKVDNYANDFGKSFDDIGDEFANVPASQRPGWVDYLEFRTNGKLVNKAGGRSTDYGSYNSNADVPQKYNSDGRFNDLATDPSDGSINSATRQEAMTGLEAESQGLVASPISRDPSGGAEFIDGNGIDWDVKAPPGEFFNVNSVGNSIQSELLNPGVKILFDATWIDDVQLGSLRTWLSNNISASDLERIVEVNSNLF